MATIGKEPNGNWRVLFVANDGSRKTIRLGECTERDAERACRHIEELLNATLHGQPMPRDTADWLGRIGDKVHRRLSRVGLVAARPGIEDAKLGASLTAYLDGRADVKPATRIVYGQVIRDLKDHFGEHRDLRSITPGQADDFKQWLIGRKLAATTVHKRLKVTRSLFNAMRRRNLIEANPFEDVAFKAAGIKDRQRFVTRDEIDKVLDACPDHHWRIIVGLSRYGGLRCPSEVLSLRWQDVNWEIGRISVPSPKMEHLGPEKAVRVIPLFPELRPILMEAFEAAPEGAEYVVDERFRRAAVGSDGWRSTNMRTTFGKIIRRAGLTPWPRLFHNLRASRETELVESFPVQVVTSWLGNTPTIAMRHYLMVTEAHFEAALEQGGGAEPVAQNPAQQVHASSGKAPQEKDLKSTEPAFCSVLQGVAAPCDDAENGSMEAGGIEKQFQPAKNLRF
jgi:integrase